MESQNSLKEVEVEVKLAAFFQDVARTMEVQIAKARSLGLQGSSLPREVGNDIEFNRDLTHPDRGKLPWVKCTVLRH